MHPSLLSEHCSHDTRSSRGLPPYFSNRNQITTRLPRFPQSGEDPSEGRPRIDYEIFLPNSRKQVHGGHNRIDYAVSIEWAKHIALMEKTERGHQESTKPISKVPERVTQCAFKKHREISRLALCFDLLFRDVL